jgi:type III secretion protein Q
MSTVLARVDAAVTDLGAANALPRIAPAAASALGRLYSGCAELALPVRGGPWFLQWRAETARLAQRDRFCFRLGPHAGVVAIDALAVASVLNERAVDRLPVELRHVLWADALHALAQSLEAASRLRFEWTVPEAGQGGAVAAAPHAAHFEVRAGSGAARFGGFVQFDDAQTLPTLLASLPLPPPAPRVSLDHLRIALPFCLGRTPIALREMAAICPGDIVSIEEWGSSGAALLVTAELAGSGLRLVGLAEGARITIHQTKDLAMNRDLPDAPASPDNQAASPLPLDRLDALEVNLRFEVGDLTLSLGELKSVRPGHVFDLGQPLNRCPVRILAHGNVLGNGHLVAVGDRLGVRVAEFAPSEIQ